MDDDTFVGMLSKHLATPLSRPIPWPKKNSGYEPALCKRLRIEPDSNRSGDAVFAEIAIEIKKGRQGFWMDLVRYSEYAETSDASFHLFFLPSRDGLRVGSIFLVPTQRIVAHFALTNSERQMLKSLHWRLGGKLNAQARLTPKQVRELSIWSFFTEVATPKGTHLMASEEWFIESSITQQFGVCSADERGLGGLRSNRK